MVNNGIGPKTKAKKPAVAARAKDDDIKNGKKKIQERKSDSGPSIK